jgi:hypothetical protein
MPKGEKKKLLQVEVTLDFFDRIKACADAEGVSIRAFVQETLEESVATYPPNDVIKKFRNMKFHQRFSPENRALIEMMMINESVSPPSLEQWKTPMKRGRPKSKK